MVTNKKIGNNTFEIIYNNGDRAIRLHHTNIITFKANGNTILDSGGWKSLTTKKRINQYLPYDLSLIQKNYSWKLRQYKHDGSLIRVFSFFDKMVLNKNYKVLNKNEDNTKMQSNQSINKLKKKIRNYVNLVDKFKKIPLPSGGDCWYCFFRDKKTSQSLGDSIKEDSHLFQHLEENYIFGSIIYNAVLEAGYCNPVFIIQSAHKSAIKHALKKYLIKRLILKGN